MQDKYVTETPSNGGGPLVMNAFEMITLSQGLNLSALFDRRQDTVKRQTRFVSREPARIIISTVETVAESMNLKVHTRNYKTRIEGKYNKGGHLAAVLEIYEVATNLFMFYKKFTGKLEDIILKPKVSTDHPSCSRNHNANPV
ncbi:hypothetical protein V2J09_018742 [Rumex salicifolius]